MRLSAPLLALIAASALLLGLFAADGAGAASGSRPDGLAALSKARPAPTHGHARQRRKLARSVARGQVANNVGLGALNQRAKPKQSAPASTAGLLFNGARISDFDLIQAAPGAITEVADPAGSGETDLQMTVNNRDVAPVTPTDNPRAQALSPPIVDNGDEFWLATKFFIPPTFPTANEGWMSLVSIYGAPFNGSSPWQVEVVDNRLQWMRNGTYHYDVPWSMPVIKGSWVSVLLHERFASDGFVEMWIDGQPISFFGRETRLNMQTMDSSNNGGSNAAKIMQYREAGMFESGSIYFGALKLGLTREAVGG